jgi:hypothetical protein
MKITIIVEDENLYFTARGEAQTFESAGEELGKLERWYAKRVAMELKDNDF